MAFPATGLTAVLVVASATGATTPPSYLVGERPRIANFIWGYGDPLFCGTPRANETREAEAFAARRRDQVVLIDLASRVCPGGPPCPAEVDGIRLRPDGRHFTPEAAAIQAVAGTWPRALDAPDIEVSLWHSQ